MRIYFNKVKEDWIVDRYINEWNEYNYKSVRSSFISDTLIWIIAPWTWRNVSKRNLKKQKVICTIHHIDEDKFNDIEKEEFLERDKYIDFYHVISNKTHSQVKKLTKKPIFVIPFWINQNLWFQIKDLDKLYSKYHLSKSSYFVGSFQRDTEGFDLKSPKLSKGPDQFIKIVKDLNKKHKNLVVLLTGRRRQYVINELEKEEIEFKYFEMASFNELNELYNMLDLYIVSSRYEGGPAAIMECALTKTPLISTNVGIADEILANKSIYDMSNFSDAKPDIDTAYNNVQKYKIPNGFDEFNLLLRRLYEN